MSSLYLTRIALTDFRSFAKLDIDLAPEPGVLVVHGTNGLGKSSLFDALEWTLTDAIDHFRFADGYKKVGTYLSRWRDELGPTSATLGFSDGSRVTREIVSAEATSSSLTGSVTDVTAFLRASEWSQSITALNRYLLLTHFLGQSIISRLTHRPPAERFEILKEASQTAELEAVGIAMHGKGSNTAARAFAKRIAEFDRRAGEMRELLTLEAQLWEAAQVSGALDDEAAANLGRQIAALLLQAKIAISQHSDWPPIGVDIVTLQSEFDTVTSNLRARDMRLARERQSVEQHQRRTAELAEVSAAMRSAETELDKVTVVVARVSRDVEQRRPSVTGALDAATAAQTELAQLTELRQAHETIAELGATGHKAREELDAVRLKLSQEEVRFAAIERHGQIVARLSDELLSIGSALQDQRGMADVAEDWSVRTGRIAAMRQALASLEADHDGIDHALAAASQDFETARALVVRENSKLASLQSSVSELTAAVTSIAAHLPAGTCECPVCAEQFPDPAALSSRVNRAAERLSPLLVDQQAAARDAQFALDSAMGLLETLQAAQNQLRFQRSEIRAEQEQADRLRESLGWNDPNTVSRKRAELDRAITQTIARQTHRRRWINRLAPDPAGLAATRSDALRKRDEALRVEAASARLLEDSLARSAAAEEIMRARVAVLYPNGAQPSVSDLEPAIDTARAKVKDKQESYEQSRGDLAQLESEFAAHQMTQAELGARIQQARIRQTSAQAALDAIVDQWRKDGGGDFPTETELDATAQALTQARGKAEEAGDSHKRLRDGREAWIRQQTHRDALDRLVAEVDLAPNATREAVLTAARARLAHDEAQARATSDAKDIAGKASADIARDVEDFSAEYLKPLGKLSNQINQAILCDPRVGVGLHVNKKRIEQSASLAGELPAKLGKVDPILVHSEGQMAALAVSMLCAASLTYPWSRWRALILDDPLQHNDAIHAAAFADLIGNLVQQKGYQVLLSTHDLSQAEFLQRKFDARRIPCAGLDLLGRGKEGVEWTFRPAKQASPPAPVSAQA